MKQLIALIMFAFLLPGAAIAAKDNPCKEDRQKHCKDAKASGGKVKDCLKQNMDKLSPACKEHMSKPKEAKEGKEKKRKKDAAKPAEAAPATQSQPQPTTPDTPDQPE